MIIDFHTHNAVSSPSTLSIRNIMPDEDHPPYLFCSAGLHPWNINANWQEDMEKVRIAAMSANTLMIGETGLDKLNGPELNLQEKVFNEHIKLSEELGKPLVIHCVKSIDEIIFIKKDTRPKQQWIIHGFRGKPQQAQQLLNNGFHLSFGERFNADSLALAFKHQAAWLETDESTHSIEEIYELAANSLNVAINELRQRIMANAMHTPALAQALESAE